MKQKDDELFWLLFWPSFAFFGYPITCILLEFLGMKLLTLLGWMPTSGVPLWGWGGTSGISFGMPLGLVSLLTTKQWQSGDFTFARYIAFIGGAILGGMAFVSFLPFTKLSLIGDFGFMAPPLAWAGCLMLFGFFVRTPKKQSATKE